MLFKVTLVLITLSCRVRWHNRELFDQLDKSDKGWILSFWHENVLIIPWLLRKRKITCMVSDSRDGEYIARCGQVFGNQVVRGSSSKGSAKATRSALRILKQQQVLAITPDGPRGPAHKLQSGVVWLGALSGAPILPFHIEVNRQWRFKSWDGQKLPKPFSTIHVGVLAPYTVDRERLSHDQAGIVSEFETVMIHNASLVREHAES
jgi:lysophospholipid acyltransferase (LPLAT)-like uncharacterized protein